MALNEACQLWIEQEIEEGLKEGKKPYSIGKEISKAIEKLFEAKVAPSTIEKRAQRTQDKCLEKGDRPTKLQQKRERKEELKHKKIYEVSDAMDYAQIAIANLECIHPDDPKRLEAYGEVENWIKKQRR